MNTAAFLGMVHSSVTRGDFANCDFRTYSDLVLIHSRSATSLTAYPRSTTCATASTNSGAIQFIKRITGPMMGFKAFHANAVIEVAHMIEKKSWPTHICLPANYSIGGIIMSAL
jgi:hypothetical protein